MYFDCQSAFVPELCPWKSSNIFFVCGMDFNASRHKKEDSISAYFQHHIYTMVKCMELNSFHYLLDNMTMKVEWKLKCNEL